MGVSHSTYRKDLERSWTMGAVNLVTGRWFRFRLVGTAGANRPTVDRIRIDQGISIVLCNPR